MEGSSEEKLQRGYRPSPISALSRPLALPPTSSQSRKTLLPTRLSKDSRHLPPTCARMLLWNLQPPSETWTFHQFHHSSCLKRTQEDRPCIQPLISVVLLLPYPPSSSPHPAFFLFQVSLYQQTPASPSSPSLWNLLSTVKLSTGS